eukprot:3941052-Rhodomonas_salina.2
MSTCPRAGSMLWHGPTSKPPPPAMPPPWPLYQTFPTCWSPRWREQRCWAYHSDTAFYEAYAGFLLWAQSSVPWLLTFHTAQVTPSTNLRSSSHQPVQHLVRVHDFLTAHGAVVVPPAPPGQAPAWTLVLPALDAIVAVTEEPAVPRQRQVTAAYMQHWHPHIDVLQRPACTASLADLLDAQKAAEYDVEDNISQLFWPGSVVELTQGTLVHAPTAWLASFDACPN